MFMAFFIDPVILVAVIYINSFPVRAYLGLIDLVCYLGLALRAHFGPLRTNGFRPIFYAFTRFFGAMLNLVPCRLFLLCVAHATRGEEQSQKSDAHHLFHNSLILLLKRNPK